MHTSQNKHNNPCDPNRETGKRKTKTTQRHNHRPENQTRQIIYPKMLLCIHTYPSKKMLRFQELTSLLFLPKQPLQRPKNLRKRVAKKNHNRQTSGNQRLHQ